MFRIDNIITHPSCFVIFSLPPNKNIVKYDKSNLPYIALVNSFISHLT